MTRRDENGEAKHVDGTPDLTRREMLRLGALGLGSAMLGQACSPSQAQEAMPAERGGHAPAQPFAAPPMDVVRIGFVGVGGMGSVHCQNLLRVPGAQLTAICDIVPEKVTRIQDLVVEAGQPRPTGYSRGEYDFVRLSEEEDLDLVFTATPWRWHVPVCVAAMQNGKHAATEVPAAITLDECWELVETAERYGKHCVQMENVNYGRWEMLVFHMVRQGLFGEVLHGEGGYLHDLRGIKFSPEGEGLWRRDHSWRRNANLYPTHGLGPIANCMDINRGDRFDYLVSMSGPSRGLQEYAQDHFPAGSPQRQETFALGDVNASLIKTARGRTIYVVHDTNLPRPYSRIHMVQGTRGLFQGYPNRVHIEGRSPAHRWEPAEDYLEEFEHPLWTVKGGIGEGIGHGGMDYLEDYRLIKCMLEGTPTDMNVYDAAALSAVIELSEISVGTRSRSVDFPDFTRGRWKTYPPLGVVQA
jgi:predicted dehydrogenase